MNGISQRNKSRNKRSASDLILTINGGSSSIKFALFKAGEPWQRGLTGNVDRIGLKGTHLVFYDLLQDQKGKQLIDGFDSKRATDFLIDWLEERIGFGAIKAVGHRLVHGFRHARPETITAALLDELIQLKSFDPDHLPGEIALIEVFRHRYPQLPQVACYDTVFHQTMPRVARLLPIPRRFDQKGVQRYGFHGLSYTYLLEELARIDKEKAQGCLILAHLGNGASLAAVRDGHCLDTTMGFTPASGLPMGTRPGDLDPGVAWYLMENEKLNSEQFNRLINEESGLLGVSEISSDLRDLIESQDKDVRAAEAIELFCYQTRKWIGAFAAVLGGLETLVFSGGIGEHGSEVRARICKGLGFLGVDLDPKRNTANAPVISTSASRVTVRVIKTDEELIIAKGTWEVLNQGDRKAN